MKNESLEKLENKMGHKFENPNLLRTALTHKSYAHQFGVESYERLEFLGDAIVGLIIAQELYLDKKFPEGMSTRIRAALVCEDTLAELSREIHINDYARLGTSAEIGGERDRKSILADMFEAHVAALYLEVGLDKTREYVLRVYGNRIQNVITEGHFVDTDYKSRLQEKIQSKYGNVTYEVLNEDGPVHDCIFTVAATINGHQIGTGVSNSKKKAQQHAAMEALAKIKAIEERRKRQGLASDPHSILTELFENE
ncbi:MAG: ribonuclease III [Clostridia bacterium]